MTEDIKGSGFSRRTIVKGAAWSVPVIATAVAAPAYAASTTNTDLVPSLSGLADLSLTAFGLPVASITTINKLTITNSGTTPTPATGTSANLQYNPSLLSINLGGIGVTVLGTPGNYTFNLPSIAPSGSFVINLGTAVSLLLNLTLLRSIIGGGSESMVASVSGDTLTTNNITSSPIGIDIL